MKSVASRRLDYSSGSDQEDAAAALPPKLPQQRGGGKRTGQPPQPSTGFDSTTGIHPATPPGSVIDSRRASRRGLDSSDGSQGSDMQPGRKQSVAGSDAKGVAGSTASYTFRLAQQQRLQCSSDDDEDNDGEDATEEEGRKLTASQTAVVATRPASTSGKAPTVAHLFSDNDSEEESAHPIH